MRAFAAMGTDRWGRLAAITILVVLAAACSGDDESDDAADTSPTTTTTTTTDSCEMWTVETLATGLGAVENALVEDDGGLLLSVADAGEVRRYGPDGEITTVLTGVPSSGGLARGDDWVYVTTGLTIDAAIQGLPSGTIVRFDPETGDQETWATGLVAPNGLALLPDGSAVTTRTLSGAGTPAEVTRVPADDPAALEPLWSDLTGTNGAAVDPSGDWLYVSRVADRAEIWRLPVDDPAGGELVADLGGGVELIPDDLTVTDDGIVYATAFVTGTVYRIDPATGAWCPIAAGMPQVTAVELDPSGTKLYATSQAGVLYELSPPA